MNLYSAYPKCLPRLTSILLLRMPCENCTNEIRPYTFYAQENFVIFFLTGAPRMLEMKRDLVYIFVRHLRHTYT